MPNSSSRALYGGHAWRTYVFCAFRSWSCVTVWTWALTASDKNVANELRFQSIMRFVRIFAGAYCRGATNLSWDAKLGYYSHYASSSLWYLCDVSPFVICIIMKALNGFLVIQKQMTLKIYNVWNLHRPRMSHGLLADNVDTTLSIIVVQQMRCSVKCTISERAEKDVRSWCAVSLRWLSFLYYYLLAQYSILEAQIADINLKPFIKSLLKAHTRHTIENRRPSQTLSKTTKTP